MVAGGGVLGTRFYAFRGGPAWHNKGTVLSTAQKYGAIEAYDFTQGAAEVETVKYRTVAIDDNGNIVMDHTRTDENGNPTPLIVPGRGLWRMPTIEDEHMRYWNNVSDDHMSITNKSVCEAIDSTGITKIWPVETMGVLDEGRCFFFTLDCGEWDIKGDPMKAYLLVREGKDGKRSFQIAVTDVRVVCTNTERMALEGAEINLRIMHDQNIHNNIQFYGNLLPQIQEAQVKMREMRARLADFRFTTEMAKQVFAEAWPMPKVPGDLKLLSAADDAKLTDDEMARLNRVRERHTNREAGVEKIREAAVDLWHLRNEEIQPRELAGTGHIAFNVVTELANFRVSHNNTVDDSIMLGEREKEMTRGFRAALALTS